MEFQQSTRKLTLVGATFFSIGVCILMVLRQNQASFEMASQEWSEPDDHWERLSDPAYLLQFVADHEKSKLSSVHELDDDLFSPLNCDNYDDDSVYPNSYCATGDLKECKIVASHKNYAHYCMSACNISDLTWAVPCGFEAIRHMRSVCNDTFQPYYPVGSSNNPSNDASYQDITIDGVEYWPCNVHAFCYSCVDDGKVNDYCKAVVNKYKSLYAAGDFFGELGDWCEMKNYSIPIDPPVR